MFQWVSKPLLEVNLIRQRQDGTESFFNAGLLRAEVRESLKPLGDLERITQRVVGGNAQPRDLVSMRETLRQLPPLRALLPDDGTLTRPCRILG